MPSDHDIERAARLICKGIGLDPDTMVCRGPMAQYGIWYVPNKARPLWREFTRGAELILDQRDVILMESMARTTLRALMEDCRPNPPSTEYMRGWADCCDMVLAWLKYRGS